MSSSSRTDSLDNNTNGTANHSPVSSSGFVADPHSESHSSDLIASAADIERWYEEQLLALGFPTPAVDEAVEDNFDDILASWGLQPGEIQAINDISNEDEPEASENVVEREPTSLLEPQTELQGQDDLSTGEISAISTPAPITPQETVYVSIPRDHPEVEVAPASPSLPSQPRKRKLVEYIAPTSVAGDEGLAEPLPGSSNGLTRNDRLVNSLPPLPPHPPHPPLPEATHYSTFAAPGATRPPFTPPFTLSYALPQWPGPQPQPHPHPHPHPHPQPHSNPHARSHPSGSSAPTPNTGTILAITDNTNGSAQQQPAQVQQNHRHLVEGVDYEVVPAAAESIPCAVQVTYLGMRVPCGLLLPNQRKVISQHMRDHGNDRPRTISECPFIPFQNKTCNGTKSCDPTTFARHVMTAHFTEKQRFRCLRCSRTYVRKEEIQREHPCAPAVPPQGEPSTAPAAGLVEEDGVTDEVGEGRAEEEERARDENREEEEAGEPVAGPSRYTEPDPPRPAKRTRRDE